MPGLTKIALPDQDKNLPEMIHEMVMSFISSENCLILAVTPANTDLANSDALKIARAVDPQGKILIYLQLLQIVKYDREFNCHN